MQMCRNRKTRSEEETDEGEDEETGLDAGTSETAIVIL